MLYDCFTFFDELDLLEIRLNILSNLVDKFVIIEGTKTFSGLEKNLNFDKKRFEKFENKIIYRVISDFPENKDAWTYENIQRNYIKNILDEYCTDQDIIILSDVDEIPNPATIKKYCSNLNGIHSLEQKFYYYYINMQNSTNPYWYFPKIFKYSEFKNNDNDKNYTYGTYLPQELNEGITPNKIRMMTNIPIIHNAGWHFSYLGGIEQIIKKVKSFSHQEYNNEKYLNKEYLINQIYKGEDIFGRGFKYNIVPLDKSFPDYILKNKEKYKKYIFQSKLGTFSKIFSIENEYRNNIKRKVITILGIKIKIKIK